MKKQYTAPSCVGVALFTESEIALNVVSGGGADTIDDKSEFLSNDKGGWNSEAWTETED